MGRMGTGELRTPSGEGPGRRAERPGPKRWGALLARSAGAGIVSLARRGKVPRRPWKGRPAPAWMRRGPGRPRAPGLTQMKRKRKIKIPTRGLVCAPGKPGKWLVLERLYRVGTCCIF